ncbi:MAG: ABC transporter ATP-binding protein [Clostridiales bacterium]|nr:ABC transporter ATP-binding protein [Clostridiales bacterium]
MSKQSVDKVNNAQTEGLGQIKSSDVDWLFSGKKVGGEYKDRFLAKLLRKSWGKILVTTLIYLLQASPTWIMPLITSDVIDLVTYRPDGYITRMIIDAVILFVVIVQNVPTTMWRSNIVNKWKRSTTAEIKSGVMRKLQRLSITYHKEIEEGKIQSKLLRDIENVEGYYQCMMFSFLPSLIGVVVSVGIALWRSPIVTLFFLAIIPLNVLLSMAFRKRIRQDNRTYRKENEQLSAKITTSIQMMTLTKAHGLVETEERMVNAKIGSVAQAGITLDKTVARFGSMMFVSGHVLSAVCLLFCCILALNDIITTGEVVLFQSLFSSISGSVMNLINSYPALAQGKEAIHSLSEIICAEDIERDEGHTHIQGVQGAVEFQDVHYHYPHEDDKPVVKNFNLTVKPGERIAVVGSSGSGKTTLMNLIIGLLAPSQGRILIDGTPLSDIPLQEYRRYLSVVPQNSILFSGTLRENITYGLSHYSEEQLKKAVEDADIEEFLPSLPHGLNTMVGEHGDKLSGGQKQRISIARALIRNPKILILDEATSALDNVAEYHVQKAIDKLVHQRTTFIVAHRLSTIRNADRIVVMENGEMVEVGTYEELIAKNGKFAELEKLSRIREEEALNAG